MERQAADAKAAITKGSVLFAEHRFAEALALTDDALAKTPNNKELLFARGSVLFAWGRYREALDSYRRAARAGLEHPDLELQVGWSLLNLGQLDDAERCFRKAADFAPESPQACLAIANLLEMRGSLGSDVKDIASRLSKWPNDYDALNFIGGSRLRAGDREGAIEAFRQAIVVDSARPRAWLNLGAALDWCTALSDALSSLERAHRLEIDHGLNSDGFVNFAMALREVGRRDEALTLLREGLARNPDVNGHWLYSMLLLEMGRLEEGWVQHEFRWLKEPLRSIRWTIRRPQWSGQDLRGKTIVLHAEQGFGDAIQFIRYAPALKQLGARVLFDSFRGFEEISADFDGVDEVLRDGKMPDFDYHLPLLSLPRVFGTNDLSIPSNVPYLRIQPGLIDVWMMHFVAERSLKVGLVWAGNPMHLRDRQRSLPVVKLAPLMGVRGVKFYSLQKGPKAAADIAEAGFDLVDLAGQINDYRDTAAAISCLDLVISVDTSVAHLTGALGRPIWMMVPSPPDWRWRIEGSDSPWYPTMRLFRQRENYRWDAVIEEVRSALTELVKTHERDGSVDALQTRTPNMEVQIRPHEELELESSELSALARVTEGRFGIVQYLPNAGVAAKSLSYYGEYRQAENELLDRFIQPGSWVLETPAGIGFGSLHLAQAVGSTGHVIAYELDPMLHQLAHQNLAANRIYNVSLLRRKLGRPSDGGVTLDSVNAESKSCDTIDGLRLERLNWIRINETENALDVLSGAVNTLWRHRPWIFVSMDNGCEPSDVIRLLCDHGYQWRRVRAPLFNAVNYNRRDRDIFRGLHSEGLLGIPEEIEIDVEL
jgi:tetratricopeptide (TPR) repeat protein